MDVRCSRCRTEYDFDDLLISERGTTVKCTNCGHQFRIFPASSVAPERWIVRTGRGNEVVYTSLRELQRAIGEGAVRPEDMVSRGNGPPRPLSLIAELEPFFQAQAPRPNLRIERTIQGVTPAGESPRPLASQAPRERSAPEASRRPALPIAIAQRTTPAFDSSPAFEAEARPLSEATDPLPPPPPPPPAALGRREAPAGMPPLPAVALSDPPSPGHAPTPRVTPPAGSQHRDVGPATESVPWPPPSRSEPYSWRDGVPPSRSSPRASMPLTPSPASSRRGQLRSYTDSPAELFEEPPPRAHSRWIAALVVTALATLLAVTVGRRYLMRSAVPVEAGPAPTADGRIRQLLSQSERALDSGDVEAAREHLLKASALAEKDPAVLTSLALVETTRADVSWLKLKLLDTNVRVLVEAENRELARRVAKARAAVDAAFAVSPEDLAVLRTRVDLLRLSGESDKAREWTQPIAKSPSDPANAYVLAALDLAEAEPSWPSVIQRLRLASSREHAPGRARAALIYALVRSGDVAEAEAELRKADAGGSLLGKELEDFVARQRGATPDKPAADRADKGARVDGEARPAGEPGAEPIPADVKTALAQARQAMAEGEIARADNLYHAVLEKQPSNVEALAGLASVARFRGDTREAGRTYDEVLRHNPSYLPALIGSADMKWEAGDRAGAVELYRRIVDRAAPSSAAGQRAAERIAQAQAGKGTEKAPTRSAPPAPKPVERPAELPPATDAPHIDTTDLPGFR